MSKSKRIPITAAKQIAEKYDKDQVIILTWDKANNVYWRTTYGVTKADCKQAAEGSERIAEFLGWTTSDIKEKSEGETE